MKNPESRKEDDESSDQAKLEKLVEQKQQETEALKRLIHVLEKIDQDKRYAQKKEIKDKQ